MGSRQMAGRSPRRLTEYFSRYQYHGHAEEHDAPLPLTNTIERRHGLIFSFSWRASITASFRAGGRDFRYWPMTRFSPVPAARQRFH